MKFVTGLANGTEHKTPKLAWKAGNPPNFDELEVLWRKPKVNGNRLGIYKPKASSDDPDSIVICAEGYWTTVSMDFFKSPGSDGSPHVEIESWKIDDGPDVNLTLVHGTCPDVSERYRPFAGAEMKKLNLYVIDPNAKDWRRNYRLIFHWLPEGLGGELADIGHRPYPVAAEEEALPEVNVTWGVFPNLGTSYAKGVTLVGDLSEQLINLWDRKGANGIVSDSTGTIQTSILRVDADSCLGILNPGTLVLRIGQHYLPLTQPLRRWSHRGTVNHVSYDLSVTDGLLGMKLLGYVPTYDARAAEITVNLGDGFTTVNQLRIDKALWNSMTVQEIHPWDTALL